MDEVHFHQFGSRCRMWVPPEEKNPVLLHHPGRQSVGYFGAVRLRDGKFVYRQERESFNAVTCWAFLKKLRRVSIRTGRKVVVIADNARYHHARLHRRGARTMPGSSSWRFCRRTARSSTRLSGCGNWCAVFASITGTSPSWTRSSSRLRTSSANGIGATIPSVAYAHFIRTL